MISLITNSQKTKLEGSNEKLVLTGKRLTPYCCVSANRTGALLEGAKPIRVVIDDLVVVARGNTPDPIPNSAVKTLSADGTPSQDVGE